MSVEGVLHHLFEAGEYWRCLETGRRLLERHHLPPGDRSRVLTLLCRAHLELGQHHGALAAGEVALRLAQALELRDLEGALLVDLATALTALRRHEEALIALERFRQGLPSYTASQCLEGAALRQGAVALIRLCRYQEARESFQRAMHWFQRYGDEESAGECLLGMVDALLAAGDADGARTALREGAEHVATRPEDHRFTGRLQLARARLHRLTGRDQASVDEAFRALTLADHLSPLQVEAQLHLSQMAEVMGRPVDALSFAFAARVSAVDGRLYGLEFEASERLVRLLREHGAEPLEELALALAEQGVDLYQYIDFAAVQRLTGRE